MEEIRDKVDSLSRKIDDIEGRIEEVNKHFDRDVLDTDAVDDIHDRLDAITSQENWAGDVDEDRVGRVLSITEQQVESVAVILKEYETVVKETER